MPLFQFVDGRIGRGAKPPPQFGQTFSSTCSTQSRQKVHSKEQIIASADAGGRSAAQFSQIGRSSRAMTTLSPVTDRDRNDGVPTIQVTVSPWVVPSIEPIGRDITLGGAKIAPNEIDWDRYDAIGGTFRAHPILENREACRQLAPQASMRPPRNAELLGAHTDQSTEPDGSVHGS